MTDRRPAPARSAGTSRGDPTPDTLLDALGEGVLVLDPDRRVLEVNDRLCAMTGVAREDLVGTTCRRPGGSAGPTVVHTAILERVSAVAEGAAEAAVQDADGRTFSARIHWSPARDGDGVVVATLVMVSDLSAREETRRALAGTAQRLDSVLASMGEGLALHGPDGRIATCNRAACRILGLTEGQIVGRDSYDPAWRAVTEDGEPFPGERHPAMVTLRTGLPQRGVVMGIDSPAHGERRWIAVSTQPVGALDDMGRPEAVVSTFADVTDEVRRRVGPTGAGEPAGERRFRHVLSAMAAGVIVVGADGRIGTCNEEARRLLGLPAGQVTRAMLREASARMVDADGRRLPAMEAPLEVTLATGRAQHGAVIGVDGPGGRPRRWMLTSSEPLGGGEGGARPALVLMTLTDITDAKSAADDARAERDFREAVIGAMGDGLIVLDAGFHIILANDRFCEQFGYAREDIVGLTPPFPWWPPEEAEAIAARLAAAGPHDPNFVETEVVHVAGHRIPVEVNRTRLDDTTGAPRAFLLTVRDVSARRAADRALRESEERFRHLVENQGDVVVRLSAGRRVVYASPSLRALAGDGDRAILDRIHPADRRSLDDAHARMTRGEEGVRMLVRLRHADGRWLWVEGVGNPVRDASGAVDEVQLSLRDVTDRVHSERDANALHRVSSLVAAGAPEAEVFAAVAAELGTVLDADSTALTAFRGEQGFVQGYWAEGDPPDTAPPPQAMNLTRRDTPACIVHLTHEPATVTGIAAGAGDVVGVGRVPMLATAIGVPVRARGRVWGCLSAGLREGQFPDGAMARVARFADLAALAVGAAETRRALELHATTDALTGLMNRWEFSDRLDAEIARARRHSHPLSLVMIDIDRFKAINDGHGHPAGDRVLQIVAGHLRAAARLGDTVARVGGEEFAWILPETAATDACAAAERLREIVATRSAWGALAVTVSIGVASLEGGRDASALYRRADAALYRAKRGGRNRVAVDRRSSPAG